MRLNLFLKIQRFISRSKVNKSFAQKQRTSEPFCLCAELQREKEERVTPLIEQKAGETAEDNHEQGVEAIVARADERGQEEKQAHAKLPGIDGG